VVENELGGESLSTAEMGKKFPSVKKGKNEVPVIG